MKKLLAPLAAAMMLFSMAGASLAQSNVSAVKSIVIAGQDKMGKTDKMKKAPPKKGKMTKGKMSKGKMTKGKMSKGKMTKGKMSKGKMTKGKMDKMDKKK